MAGRVSNPGPLALVSYALPIALRGTVFPERVKYQKAVMMFKIMNNLTAFTLIIFTVTHQIVGGRVVR